MPLNTTIDEVIAAGVRVNATNDNAMLADMEAADNRFLIPLLGDALFATALAEKDVEESDYGELVKLCKRAEAPLAYWIDLPNIQTQITDRGLTTLNATNSESAHRWEYLEVREALHDRGCAALEAILEHLYKWKAYYSWTVPDAYTGIFRGGNEFAKYYPLFQPYRTFEAMRPVARQVEDQYVRATIGDAFFEYLRDKASPTAEEKTAIELIKKTVANLTIKTACEVLPVRISVNGFTVQLLDMQENINQGQQNAPTKQVGWLYESTNRTGESYLLKLKDYLDKTASDTVFVAYKNSSYYTAPVDSTSVVSPNACRKIFGL